MTIIGRGSLAHTHIQLLNDMRRDGYDQPAMEAVFRAYRLCIELCGGYQPCGKPFIVHLLRTASILAALKRPPETIAAGLLHSIYAFGDFGGGGRKASPAKRAAVAARVSDPVESLVSAYDRMTWSDDTLQTAVSGFSRLDRLSRECLLIRLANDLEQMTDLDMLYRTKFQEALSRISRRIEWMEELARLLGYDALATSLRQAFEALFALPAGEFEALRDSKHFSEVTAGLSVKGLLRRRLLSAGRSLRHRMREAPGLAHTRRSDD
jgi:(p)ppGpp synthase/HD superfamily hydrolase